MTVVVVVIVVVVVSCSCSVPTTCTVYLSDGSAEIVVHAATLR